MFSSPGGIAFSLGSLQVHWYGIIIGVGIVLCYLYAVKEAQRLGMKETDIDAMALPVVISGVIGARLYYVLFSLPHFMDYPLEIFQVWKGGLAIHGALIGGAGAFFFFVFRRKISWLLYADVLLPGVLLAQAIGRWGNFFNNEAFGTPTSLPWKLFIPEAHRPSEYIDFSYFHPTFLYESLWNLLGFAFLALLSRRLYPGAASSRRHGIILASYLMWYSFGRFFIEALRTDSLYFGSLRAAQIMSIVLFLVGAFLLHFLYTRARMKNTF